MKLKDRVAIVTGTSPNIGGGIAEFGGTLTVTNSTIAYNHGTSGGAIEDVGTAIITDCTISGNMANYGGGIDNRFGEYSVTIGNTIVAGNGDNTIYGNGIGNSPNPSKVEDPNNTVIVGNGNNIIYGNYSGTGYKGGNGCVPKIGSCGSTLRLFLR